MSPLLFALAIEPLAAAIIDDPSIEGLRLEKKTYKISLYADDILIYLNSPQQSIPYLIDKISNFGSFSGYKIHLLKSEAMPLSKSHSHDPTISHPFKWSLTGFVYLGIKITPNLESLYKSNFAPIFKNIRSDLDRVGYRNPVPIWHRYLQCPPLILAPLVNMTKGGCENKSALFILFIFHSKIHKIPTYH